MCVRRQEAQHQEVSVVQRKRTQLVTGDDAADAGDGGLIANDRRLTRWSFRRGCNRRGARRLIARDGGDRNRFAQRWQDLALVTNVDFNVFTRGADLGTVGRAGGDLVFGGGRDAGDGVRTIRTGGGRLDEARIFVLQQHHDARHGRSGLVEDSAEHCRVLRHQWRGKKQATGCDDEKPKGPTHYVSPYPVKYSNPHQGNSQRGIKMVNSPTLNRSTL